MLEDALSSNKRRNSAVPLVWRIFVGSRVGVCVNISILFRILHFLLLNNPICRAIPPPAFIIYSPSRFCVLCYLDLYVFLLFCYCFSHMAQQNGSIAFYSALGQKTPSVGSAALVFTPECVVFKSHFFFLLLFYWIWIKAYAAYTHLACF